MLGRLGRYEISGVVGAGGMGVVLKGVDRPLDRTVAIKVLAPHLAGSDQARRRFAREARAAAAVLHPNVIAIHNVSPDGTLLWLVMPYVGGESLQHRIDQQGPFDIADILRIGAQIAAGLSAAHEQGLVHRDIKPANILLDCGVERLVITDFGLARAVNDLSMTRTGTIAGTPLYMSPEQARGEEVDERSDLFSLGSVLYTMCTGQVPFESESAYGILRQITDAEAAPVHQLNSSLPAWLDVIIGRLHAKQVDQRFASAREVAGILTQCLAHVQQPASHDLPPMLAKQRALPRWLVVVVTGLIVCGLALYGPGSSARHTSTDERPRAGMESPTGTQVPARAGIRRETTTSGRSVGGSDADPSTAARRAEMELRTFLDTYHAADQSGPERAPWQQDKDQDPWSDELDDVLQHVQDSLESF